MGKKIQATDTEIIYASKTHKSATSAAASLGIQYGTYRRHALRLGVFETNQSGKGLKKNNNDSRKIDLIDILTGKHPQYQSNKIRNRLIKEGIKSRICEICSTTEWMGKPISLELDHIDGDKNNHLLSNLRIICPNCHAQTETYRGKNTRV
jgi:5-methylcytosine-specific restriction endonuclease McrA